ncbi:hypothetical protein O6P43_005108 [Quillaja saponaria]|uniref:Uncharacterized protein n=1 Tax=Quillaja saponaria TaxID=32244 RepID=A0AAD7VH06_QUISA|nr:hypothetical protein O6P43_005108 [Quillaja saponaria]
MVGDVQQCIGGGGDTDNDDENDDSDGVNLIDGIGRYWSKGNSLKWDVIVIPMAKPEAKSRRRATRLWRWS